MTMVIAILAGIYVGWLLLFLWSLCRIAADADWDRKQP